MRRLARLALIAIVPVLAGLTLMSGCGGGEKEEEVVIQSPRKGKTKSGGGDAKELEAPTNGILKGRVVLDGAAPANAQIASMAAHNDAKICLSGTEAEKGEQTWFVGANKGVANVVIQLAAPAGFKFKKIAPANVEVEIDQPHCAFVPHVVVIASGQKLKIRNSSSVSHNSKTVSSKGVNPETNVTIPPGDSGKPLEFADKRDEINLSCQVHPWMSAKIFVADHPYIAVTDKDGNFEVRNVPTGVELKIIGAHEGGDVEGGKEGVAMKFVAGDNTREFKIKPR